MFEHQIRQGKDILRRVNLAIEKGLDKLGHGDLVYGHESDDWFESNRNLIVRLFGKNSDELLRYLDAASSHDYFERFPQSELHRDAMRYQRIVSLLQEFDAVAEADERARRTSGGNTTFNITGGQFGAVGTGATAHGFTFTQVWNQIENSVPLDQLAVELEKLREAMKTEAASAAGDRAIEAVAAAEVAAKAGSGPRALEHLRNVGMWGLQIAEKVGVEVATAAIKSTLGV